MDGDDIIRAINEDEDAACETEITRLKRKRKGLRAALTEICNVIDTLIDSSYGADDKVDRSEGNRLALQRASEKLEARYEKLQRCNNRILDINRVNDDDAGYQDAITDTTTRYNDRLQKLGRLRIDMLPNQQQGAAGAPQGAQLRPVEALKPSFTLSFDNSPTELAAWITQFRSYFEASRLHILPIAQQQAFLRQGLSPDVWTAIKQKVNITTAIFNDPQRLDEDSCEEFLEEAFQVRYPLIMRRYRFFTYDRKGNQTYTDFYAKLQELALAANLEEMTMQDYLIFRVMVGLNDPKTVDKLLSIPVQDFTLEEVNRVSVACEAAKNYSGLNTTSNANKVFQGKPKGTQSGTKPMSVGDKLNALKKQGKCIRCGRNSHPKGEVCPHKNTQCHNCGNKGHISTICAQSGAKKSNARHTNACNYTSFAGAVQGPRPTPRQEMYFQDSTHEFRHDVIPDSGSSRTIFAKSILDREGISFQPNVDNEELFNASNEAMSVNGTVQLTTTFNGRSTLVDGLVSEDLKDTVLLSWHDAEALGSLSITRFASLGNPSKRLEKIKKKFGKILKNSLSNEPMSGPPMKVHFKKEAIKKGIRPKKVYTTSQPPLHLKPAADKALAEAIEGKLLEEVPVNEPSDWCSRGFFVPKPDGGARLVVDLSHLNAQIDRPVHPFVHGTELLKNLDPTSRVFCKLDAVLGYNQIPLDEESKKLFTFLLHSGRYRCLRAPMGCSASSDEWCKRSDAALVGLPGVHKLVDDILIEAPTYEELFERIENVLNRCVESNITISLKKMQVGESVIFSGYHVSSEGVQPIAERIQAIKDFPTPSNVTAVKSFLGLATQIGHFIPDLTHATGPLKELLRKNVAWQWLPDQAKAFQNVKDILTGDLVLRTFNPKLQTELVTDASRSGLGFALLQQDPFTGFRHLIQCGSRSLTGPETRYAVCELEGLAISYAIGKCRHYLLGMENFTVVTDHKPLKGVFSKDLPDVENVRLRRYREKLTGYNFQIEWREGKLNEIADALSRYPVFPPSEADSPDFVDVCHAVSSLQKQSSDPILVPLINAAKADSDYQLIVKALGEVKFPKSLPTTHPGRQLSSDWSELSIDSDSGLIIRNGKQIYVPKSQRKSLLENLHAAHCGMDKTILRAKDLYFWRGMASEVKSLVHGCEVCRPFLASQPQQPLIAGTSATGPMTDVGSDLFQIGNNHYLVMVDRYSGCPFVEKLAKLSTSAIINILTSWFNTFGWPERFRSDNGPQFRSEFDEFCKQNFIIHENSSPYYPQSNGLSEAAVKQMKFLLKKVNENHTKFSSCLLDFRNTPNASGKSPAQMFFGRRLRGRLPHLPGANNLDLSNAISGGDQRKLLMKAVETRPGVPLKTLSCGQRVLVQNPISKSWDDKGTITEVRPGERSYEIHLDSGKVYTRNRSFLRPITDDNPQPISSHPPPSQDEPLPLRRSTRLLRKSV